MKVTLQYLGCRVNQAEIGQMEQQLRAMGHEIVELDGQPDYCIVNTCTVTKKSDDQSRNLVRKAAKTGARVLVTGCYAQLRPEELSIIEGVEAVIGNSKKSYIINEFIDKSSESALYIPQNSSIKSKFFLKVQDGCDNSCTYCSIWMARGKSTSVLPEKVMESARQAEANGFNEIVLTGIHLGMYGDDLTDFSGGVSGLLEQVLKSTSHARIRLSSLEVNEIDEPLLELMADKRVCGHLHIPLQSADDGVLKDMGRRYSSAEFIETVNLVHRRLGAIGIGTDIIAGFPTETRQAFDNTVRIVKELPFTYIHVFPYSSRPGTAASDMESLVNLDEIKGRAAVLREISAQKKDAYMNSQIGGTLQVLIETIKGDNLYMGTSDNYLKVALKSTSARSLVRGTLVQTAVAGIQDGHLYGKPMD